MPRARRDVVYNADAETIRRFFERSMAAHESAASERQAIATMNSEMERHGVHSGALTFVRRIARLKPGRRGYMAVLTIRYLEILRDQVRDPEGPVLEDPTVPAQPVAANGPAKAPAVPFERRPAA
jgi:hypothetical protein